MAVQVEIKNNYRNVLNQVKGNKSRAFTKVKEMGLEIIIDTMNTGYGRPIYLTGDLQRSIQGVTDDKSITWGTNLNYGKYVHDGTTRMAGRPFLRDAIGGNTDMLFDVLGDELAKGV